MLWRRVQGWDFELKVFNTLAEAQVNHGRAKSIVNKTDLAIYLWIEQQLITARRYLPQREPAIVGGVTRESSAPAGSLSFLRIGRSDGDKTGSVPTARRCRQSLPQA